MLKHTRVHAHTLKAAHVCLWTQTHPQCTHMCKYIHAQIHTRTHKTCTHIPMHTHRPLLFLLCPLSQKMQLQPSSFPRQGLGNPSLVLPSPLNAINQYIPNSFQRSLLNSSLLFKKSSPTDIFSLFFRERGRERGKHQFERGAVIGCLSYMP